jgi:hypothetical protein
MIEAVKPLSDTAEIDPGLPKALHRGLPSALSRDSRIACPFWVEYWDTSSD